MTVRSHLLHAMGRSRRASRTAFHGASHRVFLDLLARLSCGFRAVPVCVRFSARFPKPANDVGKRPQQIERLRKTGVAASLPRERFLLGNRASGSGDNGDNRSYGVGKLRVMPASVLDEYRSVDCAACIALARMTGTTRARYN